MTREEFDGIDTWWQLKEAMDAEGYYDDMDGDLYETEYALISEGLANAISNNCRDIDDVRRILAEIEWVEPGAEVWTASSNFTSIHNYYAEEFNEIKEGFRDWMEEANFFDDEETEEIDAFWGEARQMGTPATATAAPDDMVQPDIPLQTLMFCS